MHVSRAETSIDILLMYWSAPYLAYIFLFCFGDVSEKQIPFFQNLSPHPKRDCSVLWHL
jgi:hypothetical protein